MKDIRECILEIYYLLNVKNVKLRGEQMKKLIILILLITTNVFGQKNIPDKELLGQEISYDGSSIFFEGR